MLLGCKGGSLAAEIFGLVHGVSRSVHAKTESQRCARTCGCLINQDVNGI